MLQVANYHVSGIKGERIMHNLYETALDNEEIDIILHLTEEPVVVQKRMAEMNGTPFTTENAMQIEATVNSQQQQVLNAIKSMNIPFKKFHSFNTLLNAIALTIPSKDLKKLRNLQNIQLIESNFKVLASGATSTEVESSLEHEMDAIYSEVKALWAEGIEGQGVKVAVLDSGIDMHHPAIKHAYRGGKNFVDQSDPEKYARTRDEKDPSETSPDERPAGAPEKASTSGASFETYHGTHIAGIIAGKNAVGVKGVAPKIDLYAYRIFGAYTGGDTSTILRAIEEAVAQKMDILNLSLSDNSDMENHALSIAVNNAVLAGVVVISTAGNTGSVRGSVRAPGTARLGIAVGNSTIHDEIDSSSSRGPSRPNFDIKPDILAPGTDILSLMPRYRQADDYTDAYKRETGTSQAAPYITGVAALLKQAHPDWTPFDIKVAMANTAKVLDTNVYNVFDQGAGRVRPYAAVHPTILAYAVEEIDATGEGELVENQKGAVTFGAVTLSETITLTKPVLVKDLKGTGGHYDVTVHVTQPYDGATITVEPPSFTLDGEQLLHVTLTATKNEQTKYRDEILGYIHITDREQSVDISLPFAADFSNGATVTPAIEELSITKKDLSFGNEEQALPTEITLSINSDLSYPTLEITDYLSKAPVDSLFYDNGLSLGTRKFPLLHKYTSSWTNEEATLADGIYSIDFTGMSNAEPLTASIGPIFVKSTKPVITGAIQGATVTGQVTDPYIDFAKSLAELGEGFDVNEKLSAAYQLMKDGKLGKPVPFLLNEDGTFEVEVDASESVMVTVVDAAGNVTGELLV